MAASASPAQIARRLADIYGHEARAPLTYPFGVAISGRLRLARIDGGDGVDEIMALASPIIDAPASIPDAAPCLATGCFIQDLYDASGDRRCPGFITRLADRFVADPDVRLEDFFFAATLLGQAFQLTGEGRYAQCLMELVVDTDTRQVSGLYGHCHASPWCWGRGNAFAAVGMAEALTHVHQHPLRAALLTNCVAHLEAIATYQDDSGLWHQLLDDPATYLEHSATTMFGYAMARGIRLGWLPADTWRPVVDKAWAGIVQRTGREGELEQVCVGTGPLPTRKDYVERPFSNGRDDRGGAMALWFAVEMMRLAPNGKAKATP